MKKILAAVVLVLACAGGACAFPQGPAGAPMGPGPEFRQQKEMTSEMKARFDEMGRLREELRTELQKETPDKTKARDLHSKIVALQDSMENSRFEEMLSNPQQGMKKPDRNKDGRPAPGPEPTVAQKAKMDSLMKLEKQIRDEFRKEKPDTAKIRSWSRQAQKIRNSLDDERLEEMLKDPSKYREMPDFGPGPKGPRGPERFPATQPGQNPAAQQ